MVRKEGGKVKERVKSILGGGGEGKEKVLFFFDERRFLFVFLAPPFRRDFRGSPISVGRVYAVK